jgi:uncharacterized protein (TIGR03437 family)
MCHNNNNQKGGPINAYGGSVSAAFSSGTVYIPGAGPITITVTATDPVNKHFGFQMTARVASTASSKNPQQAGSFDPGSNPNIIVLCADNNLRPSGGCASSSPYEYIEHYFTAYQQVYTTSQSYQFTWTPPSTDVGPVTFYLAGNVVNYDNQPDAGDHVYTASYTLTPAGALPAPTVVPGGVLNAASFAKTSSGVGAPVAPGSLVAIFGSNLGYEAHTAVAPFLNSLGYASVTIGGMPAPMRDVLPSGPYPTINAQVPFEVSGTVPVVVTVNGVPSAPQNVTIVPEAPGVFTIPSGVGNAVVVNLTDFSIAAPTGSISGLSCHPIARGAKAFLYATGLGVMTPAVADGTDGGSVTHNVSAKPTVLVDGIPVTPDFAGQAPLYPGVYQVNFTIPQGAHSGTVNLQIQSADGSVVSAAGISTIAIQ